MTSNPGYRCGFFHAPSYNGAPNAANVTVPIAFVHGLGDTVVNWSTSANYFNAAWAERSLKFIYLLNQDCDHNNMCASYLSRPQDLAVIGRIQKVFVGFFRCFLLDDAGGLESSLGTEGRSEPRLAQISLSVQQPQLWVEGSGQLGSPCRISTVATPGQSALLLALQRGFTPTPFGTLLLDPSSLTHVVTANVDASGLRTVDLSVPTMPSLVGLTCSFQASGLDAAQKPHLTGAGDLRILP